MFRDIAVGSPVTIAVCKEGEVIIHVDKDSEVLRSGIGYPDKKSALVGFRHLRKHE